jgi:hypothetical protein
MEAVGKILDHIGPHSTAPTQRAATSKPSESTIIAEFANLSLSRPQHESSKDYLKNSGVSLQVIPSLPCLYSRVNTLPLHLCATVFPVHLALSLLLIIDSSSRVNIYCSLHLLILLFLTSSIPSHLFVSSRVRNLPSTLPIIRVPVYDE